MNKPERIAGYPIFLIGVLADKIKKQHNPSRLFFFIPHYHTGGAEQVHVDILRVFAKERPLVVIVNKSHNDYHKAAMRECAEVVEIGKYYNNQNRFFVKNFFLGYYTSLVKRHQGAILISSLCSFLTDLSSTVKDTFKIDIIHGYCGINPKIHINPTPYLDRRVLVSHNVHEGLLAMYDAWGVDPMYKERLRVIHNAVKVEDQLPEKQIGKEIKVVFIGRNSHEKRYHLYEQIALSCKQQGLAIQFFSIGNFSSSQNITCLGEIRTREAIYQALQDFHMLILCSNSEGFPLVILEAMACGLVPLSTAVGGVAEMISEGETGNLIQSEAEDEIVSDFVSHLQAYAQAPELLQKVGRAAYERVKSEFNYRVFGSKYRALIEEAREEIASRKSNPQDKKH